MLVREQLALGRLMTAGQPGSTAPDQAINKRTRLMHRRCHQHAHSHAGRKLAEIEARREQGLPVGSTTGALTEERRDALEAIDPSWCPAWPVVWQRAYVLCRRLIEAGTPLPTTPGQMTLQGEDLGAWVQAQRLGWDQLATAQ